jgi:hypothetical protein
MISEPSLGEVVRAVVEGPCAPAGHIFGGSARNNHKRHSAWSGAFFDLGEGCALECHFFGSPRFSNEPHGLAIAKQHPDFVGFVNAVLQRMRTNGQWAVSYAHWVGTPVPAPPPAHYQH